MAASLGSEPPALNQCHPTEASNAVFCVGLGKLPSSPGAVWQRRDGAAVAAAGLGLIGLTLGSRHWPDWEAAILHAEYAELMGDKLRVALTVGNKRMVGAVATHPASGGKCNEWILGD